MSGPRRVPDELRAGFALALLDALERSQVVRLGISDPDDRYRFISDGSPGGARDSIPATLGRRPDDVLTATSAAMVRSGFAAARRRQGPVESIEPMPLRTEVLAVGEVFPLAPDGTVGWLTLDLEVDAEAVATLSQAHADLISEAAGTGTWSWNLTTNEVRWNELHERLLGYEPGRPNRSYDEWRVRVHPDDVDAVEAAIQRAIATGERYDAEYRAVLPDGSTRYLAGRGALVPGMADRMVGIVWDVTDRRVAEEERRRSQSMLEVALGLAGIGTTVWNLATDGISYDAVARRIFDMANDTDDEQPSSVGEVLDADRPFVVEQWDRAAAGEPVPPFTFRFRRRDGEARHIMALATRVGDGPFVVTAARDVTDEVRTQQAEARAARALRTLSRGMDVVVHATDEASLLRSMCGTIVDVGGYVFAWYGRPRESGLIELVASEGPHLAWMSRIQLVWDPAHSLGSGPGGRAVRERATQVASSEQIAALLPTGTEVPFRSVIVLPVVVADDLDGVLVVWAAEDEAFDGDARDLLTDLAASMGYGIGRLRDAERVTAYLQESVRAERERRELIDRNLTISMRERSRLALDLHDDPIQRLSAAMLRLNMAARDATPDVAAAISTAESLVREATRSLRELIFELAPPDLPEDGLQGALETAVELLFRGTTVHAQVEVDLADEPDERTATLLYRVAVEAIGNVRRHADARTVTVRMASADGHYHLTIEDDGSGFGVDQAAVAGHLGLRSMQERASLLDGWVEVRSVLGVGTVVELVAPVRLAETGETSEPAEAGAQPAR